jgi:UDP-N-acetylmuramoyl-L-alanyl-D-glutamate--2,6-diaminopimelate ligase
MPAAINSVTKARRPTAMASTHVGSGRVSLREVLPKARFTRGGDLVVTKHTSDWRDCAPGDLYVALTTADGDGHEYAREAIARGAIAVLAERLLPVDAPVVIVKDTRTALGRLTQALAGFPCRTLRTVGVTGTAGKTVTAMLLSSIFEKAGEAVGVLSSVGYSDSLMQVAAQETTPSTQQFGEWLARMVSARGWPASPRPARAASSASRSSATGASARSTARTVARTTRRMS